MKPLRTSLLILSVGLYFFNRLYAQAPANFDFEQSAAGIYSSSASISGWTLQSSNNSVLWGGVACVPNPPIVWNTGASECSIVATPVWSVPFIGFLPHSPLGGNRVVRLQDTQISNGPMTRLSTQFQVTAQSDLLRFCFAGAWQGLNLCCDAAVLRIDFYNCSNSLTLLPQLTLTVGACVGPISCSLTGSTYWTNWQTFTRDLSPYTGQCIQMVVTVADEAFGGRFGTAFFDAKLYSHLNGLNGNLQSTASGAYVNFCPGYSIATIQGPYNYTSYQWIAPGNLPISAPNGTSRTLSLTSPITIGAVYTLQASNSSGSIQTTYTIQNSFVNVAGFGSTPSCAGGSNGSATLVANGSSAGYTYQWLNNSSLTVGTASTVNNLPAGTYTVLIGASGNSLCGTASQTIAIASKTVHSENHYKPICSPIHTLCGTNGSNYQWYLASTPVSAPTGTMSCLNISSPVNGSFYKLTYSNTVTGCTDSLNYFFVSTLPGSVTVSQSGTLCAGLPNGLASLTLSPALANTPGPFHYSVISTASPALNYTFQSSSSSPTLISGLYAGVQYSLTANDGNCSYQTTFSLSPFSTAFTLTPAQATLCSGNAQNLSIQFTHLPGQYTFSWSPSTFLQNTNSALNVAQATLAPGSSSTIIYTVVVTPTALNCSSSKTMTLTFVQALSPTLQPIPLLCADSGPYTIGITPGGGTLSSNFAPFSFSTPLIHPSTLSPGSVYFLNYSLATGPCLASNSQSFAIGGPQLSVFGDTVICLGSSASFFAGGANTYTWSTGANSSSIQILPNASGIYTVSGNHNADNCVSSKTIALQVLQPPNLQVSGNQQICAGNTATLSASGALTYTWSTGQQMSTIIVQPTVSSLFSVVAAGNSNTCLAQAQVSVQVNPKPNLFVSGNSFMCLGDENLFTVAGADTYSWSTGALTNSIVISPLQNFTLTVVGTYTDSGCSSTLLIGVDVEECVNLPERKNEPTLKLYPNPSAGIYILECDKALDVVILNAQGSILCSGKTDIGKTELDLRAYPQGLYFVECRSGKECRVEKLIKQ